MMIFFEQMAWHVACDTGYAMHGVGRTVRTLIDTPAPNPKQGKNIVYNRREEILNAKEILNT